MVSYILGGFFAVVGALVLTGTTAIPNVVVATVLWTIAALVIAAQRSEERFQQSRKNHPSGKARQNENDTQLYDWKNDPNYKDWNK